MTTDSFRAAIETDGVRDIFLTAEGGRGRERELTPGTSGGGRRLGRRGTDLWLVTAYARGALSRGKIWAQQFRIGRTIDHKERIEHKATAEDSQIGGVFALFVFYVAKIRPAFSATNFTNLHESSFCLRVNSCNSWQESARLSLPRIPLICTNFRDLSWQFV